MVNVGVDWGFEHCQIYAVAKDGGVLLDQRVATEPAELRSVVASLVAAAPEASAVHVGIEKATGRVVEHLLGAGLTVYNVNPGKVDAGRKLVSMSGAKDDRRDARVLAKLVGSFRDELVPLVPTDAVRRRLRHLGRQRHALVKDRTRLTNRLSAAFREHFPAMLDLGKLDTQWQILLAQLIPTPAAVGRVGRVELEAALKGTRRTVESVRATLGSEAPVAADGVYEALEFEVPMWAAQLLLVQRQIAQVERQSSSLLDELRTSCSDGPSDVEIVASLPTIGKRTATTLFGEGLIQSNLQAARCVAGVAPVTEATGKRQTARRPTVKMRRACNHFIRDALHNAVMAGVGNHQETRVRYRHRRERGMTEGAACRAEGDRILRILHAMLRDRTLYRKPVPPPE